MTCFVVVLTNWINAFCMELQSSLYFVLTQIADREVAQGGIGSGKLREDALSTLRHILVKVQSLLSLLCPMIVACHCNALKVHCGLFSHLHVVEELRVSLH